MPGFQPLYLGNVIRDAEAIKAARNNAVTEQLQQEYLRGNIARAPAQEARAAAQEGRSAQQFAGENGVFTLRLLNAAAAEIAANPQAAARWMPQLKTAGLPIDQLGALDQNTAKQLFESTSQALQAYERSQNNQDTVQSSQILENGNLGLVFRSGNLRDTGQKVRPQMFYGDVGGVPAVTRATGTDTNVTPLSSLPAEAGARQTLANAQAAGAAEVIPAEARSAARDKIPRARAAFRRLGRVADAVENLADNMILQGGPFQSGALSVTKEGQELDNAVAQLMPEITALTRVPGVGSQSDLEQRLANLALPASSNYPDVNRKAIAELETFLSDLEAAYSNVASGVSSDAPSGQSSTGQWSIRQVD